jgi:cytochrome c
MRIGALAPAAAIGEKRRIAPFGLGASSDAASRIRWRSVLPSQEHRMRSSILTAVIFLAGTGAAAAQDAAAGERVFAQCRACHQVGESAKNAVGPVLNGLFGRKSGTIEGYNYTPANKNSGIVWDEATFADYIKDPRAKIPGTKMVYAGLKDEKRVQDLIAYLKQFDAAGKKAP